MKLLVASLLLPVLMMLQSMFIALIVYRIGGKAISEICISCYNVITDWYTYNQNIVKDFFKS